MSPRTPATIGRRSDAKRNRHRILAVAREAFQVPDAEISMAEISRLAGVGMATLYRNFAGRHELLEALYGDEVDEICLAAETVRGATDGARFIAWLRAFFSFVTSKRHVATELLELTGENDPVFGNSRARVTAAGIPLLEAAQLAGEIRSDLSLDQILDIIHALAMIPGDSGYLAPILSSTLDGLRAPA